MSDKVIRFTSANGFEYSFDQDASDDLELFEYLRIANDPNEPPFNQLDAAIKGFVCIIGREQDDRLRKFLKERDGRIKTTVYRKEISEVMNHLGDAKKK